jgi:TRAP-type uncharacterized transport system fused permease subunit
MDADLIMALAIGLMVLAAIYLAVDLAFPNRDPSTGKAKGVFAGAAGLLVAVYLWRDPAALRDVSGQLAWQAIAIVVALLALLRGVIRRR